MAIVVDLQLGRSLLLPSAHTYNAVVELLDEARRGARDHPGDLAHLPAVHVFRSVDSAVNQAVIECRRLWGDSETIGY